MVEGKAPPLPPRKKQNLFVSRSINSEGSKRDTSLFIVYLRFKNHFIRH
jgi:hypothetical protein